MRTTAPATATVTRWRLAAALTLFAPLVALHAQNAANNLPAASTAPTPAPKMSGGKKCSHLPTTGAGRASHQHHCRMTVCG